MESGTCYLPIYGVHSIGILCDPLLISWNRIRDNILYPGLMDACFVNVRIQYGGCDWQNFGCCALQLVKAAVDSDVWTQNYFGSIIAAMLRSKGSAGDIRRNDSFCFYNCPGAIKRISR